MKGKKQLPFKKNSQQLPNNTTAYILFSRTRHMTTSCYKSRLGQLDCILWGCVRSFKLRLLLLEKKRMDVWDSEQGLPHRQIDKTDLKLWPLGGISNMLNPENLLLEYGRRDSCFKHCRQKKLSSDPLPWPIHGRGWKALGTGMELGLTRQSS